MKQPKYVVFPWEYGSDFPARKIALAWREPGYRIAWTKRGNIKTVVDSHAPPPDIALDLRRYWIVNWETGNCYAVGTPRGNIKTVVY